MSSDESIRRDPEQHDDSAIEELPPRDADARAAGDVKGGATSQPSMTEIVITKKTDTSSAKL